MGEFLAHLGNFLFLLVDLFEDDFDRGFLDPGPAACGRCCCGRCCFLWGHKPSLGLWVGCERAVLLREQEQETAHGVDLALNAIESAKSGAMASRVEIVRHRCEPGQELRVNRHGPFDNALAKRRVEITRLRFWVLFGHWSVPQLLWWIDLLIREA